MKNLIFALIASSAIVACGASYEVAPNVPDTICVEAGRDCYFDHNGERFYWNEHYKCWCGPRGHFIGGRYHHGYPHH